MNDTMRHRGPDGHGICVSDNHAIGLGSRRLSLVELSSKGKQPMTKHNRTIVFNGEIYNYRALLKELKEIGYGFSSHSDTEVILSAFEEWGIECLHRFNGAFAFVLYDHGTEDVYIVRDRIGEKPLYYTETSDYFIFASEIKAIMTIPGVKLKPNIETFRINLIFHFFSDKDASYFEHINSLRPGHYITIKNGKLVFHKYWDISVFERLVYEHEERRVSKDIESIHDLLEDATRIRLSADCPVGCLLSGGIDSSLLAMFAAKNSSYPITCFTLSFRDLLDEDLQHAQMVVKAIPNLTHFKTHLHDGMFSPTNIDRITRHLEEVVLHKVSVYVNTNYITIHANNYKTVLNGQGSDEIACGYYTYYDFHHFDSSAFTFNNFSRYWYDQFTFKDFMDKKETKRLIDANLKKNYLPYITKDLLNSVLAFGIKTHLLNILNHEDRFSMAESVECRTVYTDYRLIEKLMSIPSKYKILDGREKYLMRKLGQRYLPKEITKRKKLGYPNISDHFEEEFVRNIIRNKNFRKSDLLHRIFNNKMFDQAHKLPLGLQWKLANIYRFEKVFLN